MKLSSQVAKKLHVSEKGFAIVEKILIIAAITMLFAGTMNFFDSCCIPYNHSITTTSTTSYPI
jgi:hypothetical protein